MTDGDMDLSERCQGGGLIHVVSRCGGDEADAMLLLLMMMMLDAH